MGKPAKGTENGTKCYSCKVVEWITYATPRKLHKFIYSRKNLLLAFIIALVAYFVTSGQPEIARRTIATFVFAAGC